jgi:predicted nucleotidyltransferase
MALSNELRQQIRASLEALQPEKVILFGSYAQGTPHCDSDLDLIVVLNSDAIPTTYHERAANRLQVRRALDALNRDYALDVLVYTRPEWRSFQDSGSAFSREVATRGLAL